MEIEKWIEEIDKRVGGCNVDSVSSLKGTVDAIRQILFFVKGNIPHPSELNK